MKKKEMKIGGEFEIDPVLIHKSNNFFSKNTSKLFSSGRSALMAILLEIQKDRGNKSLIYLPFYICSSVVEACQNAKFEVKFYEIDQAFLFPLKFIGEIEERASLLSVNYFGLVNDNIILKAIKNIRSDIITISDNVQSLWDFQKSIADYSFTSLRKHISVPDGAIVSQQGEILKPSKGTLENSFYKKKISGATAKYRNEEDAIYLSYFEEGEELLDQEASVTKASSLSEYIFQNMNWENIMMIRKDNYRKIYEIGSKKGLNFIFNYSEKEIPLCVPILVKNRDEIREKLFNKNIYLPIHWSLGSYNDTSNIARKMAKDELSLIIDQRYTEEEMAYQIETLLKYLK